MVCGFKKSIFLQRQHILLIFVLFFLFSPFVLYAMDMPSGEEEAIVLRTNAVEFLRASNLTERIEEMPNSVNMHYEYDDIDINNLLLLRAQEVGLNLPITVLMPPLDNMGNQIIEQLHEEGRRYQERVLAQEIEPVARTILVPINLNNIHWVGLVIRLNERSQVLQIQYIDPLGDSTFESSIPEEIRRSLSGVYGSGIRIENLMLLRQTDGTSCGVLTVENLIRAAQGQLDTEIVHEELTGLIRDHHADLLERFRPDLRFNLRQREGYIGIWGIRKAMKLSFMAQINDLRFYWFFDDRTSCNMFICFEGMAGIGKTTQCQLLKERIEKEIKRQAVITKALDEFSKITIHKCFDELGLNNDPTVILLMFSLGFVKQRQSIEEALVKNQIVIADRWKETFHFYNDYFGPLASKKAVQRKTIVELVTADLEPDLTIIIDMGPKAAESNCIKRAKVRLTRKATAWTLMDELQKAREYYAQAVTKKENWIVIDGTSKSIQQIHEEIWSIVKRLYVHKMLQCALRNLGNKGCESCHAFLRYLY